NMNAAADCLPVMRGDEALAGLARVDVIKIDTEGFEAKVLAGLKETLARHRPVVLFELTPPVAASLGGTGTLEQGLMALLGPGWRLRCLQAQGERYRLIPFSFDGHGQAIAVAIPEHSRLG
ncbi:MAG: FkbM family methyltransferase, partial [Magnetospirillum sp.]|nr:FkbM family methyltransferase [Magnetospirillum sp.]